MTKEYKVAPLPFIGQKRMFAAKYKQVLKDIEGVNVVVDLFGGSGLLSHITKRQRPELTVVYNDFDNYRQRLANVDNTNAILGKLREMVAEVPQGKLIPPRIRGEILGMLDAEEQLMRCLNGVSGGGIDALIGQSFEVPKPIKISLGKPCQRFKIVKKHRRVTSSMLFYFF